KEKPGEIPDLRSFTLGYVPLPRGAVLIPMTDGVYDNLSLEEIKEIIKDKTEQVATVAIVEAAKNKAQKPGGKPDDTSCAWVRIG
ncbi:MAG TPA: hypothetical protein VHK67_07035, partial [Rhabdochlamydiaceae bacterium]|nr:hypothetical protein [Rhabdochlamydiaceae bacterium]